MSNAPSLGRQSPPAAPCPGDRVAWVFDPDRPGATVLGAAGWPRLGLDAVRFAEDWRTFLASVPRVERLHLEALLGSAQPTPAAVEHHLSHPQAGLLRVRTRIEPLCGGERVCFCEVLPPEGVAVVGSPSPQPPVALEVALRECAQRAAAQRSEFLAAQETLLEWVNRFDLLVEGLGLLLFEVDRRSGKTRWWGPLLGRLGLDEEAPLSRRAFGGRVVHPEDLGRYLAGLERREAELDFSPVAYRLRAADGTFFHVSDQAVARRDQAGRMVGVVGIVQDVSARQEALAALEEKQARLDEAQRIARLGHWDWNVETDALFWSPEIFRLFRLAPAAFPATYPAFVATIHPDDRAAVAAAVERALRREAPYGIEHRIVLPDGEIRVVLEHGHVTFAADGRPVRMLGTVQDVTERAALDEALRASEERYRVTFERAPVGFMHVATDLTLLRVNDRMCELTGYRREELLGRPLADLMPEILHEPANGEAAAVLAGLSTPELHERQVVCRDGALAWVNTTAQLVPGGRGEPAFALVIVEDDEERHRVAEQRRQAKEHADGLLRLVMTRESAIEGSLGAIAITDLHGDITYANPAFAQLWGLGSASETLGRNRTSFWSDPSAAAEALGRTYGAGSWTGELVAVRADGEQRTVEVGSTLLRDSSGEPLGIVGSFLDITDRQRATAALRESEERFRQIAENVTVALWVATPDMRQVYYLNPAFERIWGRTAAELAASHSIWHATIHPDDVARVSAVYLANPTRYDVTLRIVRPDGSIRWIRMRVHPVAGTHASSLRVVAIAEDITSDREAEELRRRATEELNRSLQEKSVLLREVHHRVKNNLQVIASLLSLQARRITDPVARLPLAESRDRINSIALVHENLYRADDFGRVDFRAYLGRLLEGLHDGLGERFRGIRFHLDAADVRLDVSAAIPCGLIVNELATNAAKYAFVGRKAGRVEVRVRPLPGAGVQLEVEDDGVGLPAEFDLTAADTLGLTLVRTLAGQLGAEVAIASSPGRGTRFTLAFWPT